MQEPPRTGTRRALEHGDYLGLVVTLDHILHRAALAIYQLPPTDVAGGIAFHAPIEAAAREPRTKAALDRQTAIQMDNSLAGRRPLKAPRAKRARREPIQVAERARMSLSQPMPDGHQPSTFRDLPQREQMTGLGSALWNVTTTSKRWPSRWHSGLANALLFLGRGRSALSRDACHQGDPTSGRRPGCRSAGRFRLPFTFHPPGCSFAVRLLWHRVQPGFEVLESIGVGVAALDQLLPADRIVIRDLSWFATVDADRVGAKETTTDALPLCVASSRRGGRASLIAHIGGPVGLASWPYRAALRASLLAKVLNLAPL